MRDELAPFVEMANGYPMLSAEEENRLTVAWQKRGDKQALDELVGSHLRLVIKIARDNRGYGLPISDLIGERLALTLTLSVFTILFTWSLAIPIGMFSAVKSLQNTPWPQAVSEFYRVLIAAEMD